jgi:hypothetical protein
VGEVLAAAAVALGEGLVVVELLDQHKAGHLQIAPRCQKTPRQ